MKFGMIIGVACVMLYDHVHQANYKYLLKKQVKHLHKKGKKSQ